MATPQAASVVVNWNGVDDTRRCVESLRRAELDANWARAEAHLPLDRIEPLP